MLVHVAWQTATADKKHTDKIKSLYTTKSTVHIAAIVLFALAGLLVLVTIVVCALYRKDIMVRVLLIERCISLC